MNWEAVFNRLSKGALENGELTDDEYRELLITDDVRARLDEMIEVLRNKKLAQLVKGAEFIESITPEDPRYHKALEKYNRISESLEYQSDKLPVLGETLWSVYTAMAECHTKYGRTLKYEELKKKFPNLTYQQIRWGMYEFGQEFSKQQFFVE